MDFGFLLKKFVSFFIEPSGMVISLFLIWLILLKLKKKKLAKVSLSLAVGIFFIFSYPPVANFLISNLENQYQKYSYSSDIKYIHVLGSDHNGDNSQPLSSKISDGGIKRVLEGVLIYKQVVDSKLILTGYGGDQEISTGKMNANLALALGVEVADIILGEEAKDTQEEAIFAKEIVGNKPFVLVTSASHMPRSIMLFESLGLKPIAAPTAFYKQKFDGFLKIPTMESFFISQIAMHEYWGLLWGKLIASLK